jgi:hypothetical protein
MRSLVPSQSFTMIGAADIANCMSENGDFDDLAGITPRAVSELFRLLNERTAQLEFVVSHLLRTALSLRFSSSLHMLHLMLSGIRWRCRCSSCTATGWTTC